MIILELGLDHIDPWSSFHESQISVTYLMTVFIQTSRALHLVWVTMKHSRACWCLLYRKQENFKLEYLSRIT